MQSERNDVQMSMQTHKFSLKHYENEREPLVIPTLNWMKHSGITYSWSWEKKVYARFSWWHLKRLPNLRIKGKVDPMVCITPNFQTEIWDNTEKWLSKKERWLVLHLLNSVTLKNTLPVPQYKYFSSFQNTVRVLNIQLGLCASAESEGAIST